MNDFDSIIKRMTVTHVGPEDYTGEDGLLYYGKCRTPKQFRMDAPPMEGRLFPCQCEQERIDLEVAEQKISVRMTNFALILNDLTASFEGHNEYIARLCRFALLVIDDFGMERGTEYGLEQVYNMINRRYRNRRPLIVTANIPPRLAVPAGHHPRPYLRPSAGNVRPPFVSLVRTSERLQRRTSWHV